MPKGYGYPEKGVKMNKKPRGLAGKSSKGTVKGKGKAKSTRGGKKMKY